MSDPHLPSSGASAAVTADIELAKRFFEDHEAGVASLVVLLGDVRREAIEAIAKEAEASALKNRQNVPDDPGEGRASVMGAADGLDWFAWHIRHLPCASPGESK